MFFYTAEWGTDILRLFLCCSALLFGERKAERQCCFCAKTSLPDRGWRQHCPADLAGKCNSARPADVPIRDKGVPKSLSGKAAGGVSFTAFHPGKKRWEKQGESAAEYRESGLRTVWGTGKVRCHASSLPCLGRTVFAEARAYIPWRCSSCPHVRLF